MFDGIVSENIVSDLADKGDFSSDSLCGNRLIGAFPPALIVKTPPRTVSPGAGSAGVLTVMSVLLLPKISIFFIFFDK